MDILKDQVEKEKMCITNWDIPWCFLISTKFAQLQDPELLMQSGWIGQNYFRWWRRRGLKKNFGDVSRFIFNISDMLLYSEN